jgi:hypothetical protein
MAARLIPFVLGATSFGFLLAALFFARFYRDTRDGLFVYFALGFVLEALGRALSAFESAPNVGDPSIYLLRTLAYSFILLGIYRKNRAS